MGVAIVTDTVSCLPIEIQEKYKILVVPLEIAHNGKIFRDGIDITPTQFYELLASSAELPTTTAPPPETYMEVYRKFVNEGKQILVVCPSRKLTHVFESANIAANMMKEIHPEIKLEVIDSGTAAGAQGFVVYDAARTADAGGDLNDVLKTARDSMKKVHVIVCLDTLDYLAKSGRVPALVARANNLLKIKPIIELLPLGRGVIPVDRARTFPRAMDKLIQTLRKRAGSAPVRVIVQHTNVAADAGVLAERIKQEFFCSELYIKDFTPVMGVHTGPGLIGFSYCLDNSQGN